MRQGNRFAFARQSGLSQTLSQLVLPEPNSASPAALSPLQEAVGDSRRALVRGRENPHQFERKWENDRRLLIARDCV